MLKSPPEEYSRAAAAAAVVPMVLSEDRQADICGTVDVNSFC